jgi:hypothetical protein
MGLSIGPAASGSDCERLPVPTITVGCNAEPPCVLHWGQAAGDGMSARMAKCLWQTGHSHSTRGTAILEDSLFSVS